MQTGTVTAMGAAIHGYINWVVLEEGSFLIEGPFLFLQHQNEMVLGKGQMKKQHARQTRKVYCIPLESFSKASLLAFFY